jgi:hypothetical protein
VYLLPKEDPVMKKILDGSVQYCDIYTEEKPFPTNKQICDEFVRFVEMHVNKIKRVQHKPKLRVSEFESDLNILSPKYSVLFLKINECYRV